MNRIVACGLVVFLCVGCASVSEMSSATWQKTKSLFGAGDGEPKGKKVTLETYPSRTTVSTLEQPKMQVQTKPTKVEVQPRTAPPSVAPETVPQQDPAKPDRANLSPAERRLEERIDRKVEELRKKHKSGSLMGIFR